MLTKFKFPLDYEEYTVSTSLTESYGTFLSFELLFTFNSNQFDVLTHYRPVITATYQLGTKKKKILD